ncbi:MAG TPA: glycosyltransferase family 4 protein, partial [Pyrinomonadaceae bacterium]|nr:glycosyltransferase family 4 protein [Pyrinomonadaceae bacterium]
LEAFACGLPVVTTNAGGIPNIVTHVETGLMVQRGDYEGMAREAIRLLNDAALAERIARQARAECQKYSWVAVRRQWLELYEGLARTPEGQQPVPRKQKAESKVIDSVAPK